MKSIKDRISAIKNSWFITEPAYFIVICMLEIKETNSITWTIQTLEAGETASFKYKLKLKEKFNEKIINVVIRSDFNQHRQLLIIENTYKDKSVNLDKIYEKGFSTKEKNTGLGLWEVNKIIKRHKNLARFTTKDDKFFKQQIEIYEK